MSFLWDWIYRGFSSVLHLLGTVKKMFFFDYIEVCDVIFLLYCYRTKAYDQFLCL